jgi:hypothetical protein
MSDNVNPKSRHIPEYAAGVETVTGTLVVHTGLREIQSVTASFGQDLIGAQEALVVAEISATVPGDMTLKTYTAAGVAGVVPSTVCWMALGR